MRRAAVYRFEKPDEMEFGKARLVGDFVEIDIRRKVGINEKFCFYRAKVKILPRVLIHPAANVTGNLLGGQCSVVRVDFPTDLISLFGELKPWPPSSRVSAGAVEKIG